MYLPRSILLSLVLLLAAACHRSSDDFGGAVAGPPATNGLDVEIAPNFAWVSWVTTDLKQGCAQWGLTESYGDVACEPDTGLEHRVLLSALEPERTYHYQIGYEGPEGHVYGIDRVFVAKPEEAIHSDDFNYPNLDRERWQLVDPKGLGTLELEGAGGPAEAGVRLSTPAWEDYSVDGDSQALRLMQNVGQGPFSNIVKLKAAIDCPGESCGTLWAEDDENFLRFGFDYTFGDVYLTGVITEDGVVTESASQLVIFGSWFGDFPLYLRVQSKATGWLADWSFDGVSWQPGVQLQQPLNVVSGGIYVASGEGFAAGVSLLADFSFDANFPIEPQDQTLRADRSAPYIYRLDPEVLSETQLRLGWFTDEPCDGTLDWGVAPNLEFHEHVDEFALSQSVTLENLDEHMDYVLRARASDAGGRESLSEELVLGTEDD